MIDGDQPSTRHALERVVMEALNQPVPQRRRLPDLWRRIRRALRRSTKE